MSPSVESRLQITRLVGLVASTTIALAAGTNYVYSAYAPQLASRLHLSATESNLIGTFGNLGMYLSGIPTGMIVDHRGPRLPVLAGSFLIFAGYFPIYLAFEGGRGSMGVPALCFFSTLTGIGGCTSFSGAMKAAALNFPHHRGTATAFPLAAFGLSAFFFSSLSGWFFPGNTSDFLLVLTMATSLMIFISFFFVRVVHTPATYAPLPASSTRDDYEGSRLHRAKSEDSTHPAIYEPYQEPGTRTTGVEGHRTAGAEPNPTPTPDETSSFLTGSSSSSDAEENRRDEEAVNFEGNNVAHHGHHVDIRGWALARSTDFWLLFSMVGCLTGVGLMTINNIGHDAHALWGKHDPAADPEFVARRQGMHVSIISLCSFTGRMASGIVSDILLKKYQLQRVWLMVAAASIFSFGQIFGLAVEHPDWLWTVSSLNGLGYGVLFGVSPTIVSEYFGLHGLSQNWGTMTLSAVISGNIMNLFYGRVYDDHSEILPDGDRECMEGLTCYRNAYVVTIVASLAGLAIALLSIQRNRVLYGVTQKQ